MSKPLNFLLGPELIWAIYYFIVLMIIRLTHSPVKSMDSFWLALAYIIPLVLLPLTFVSYYIPGVIRPWLLLRLWIAGVIGCHLVLNKAMLAYSDQGPGIGTAYMMGMGFAFFALIAGTIWAVIKF